MNSKKVLFVLTNHAVLGNTGKKTGYYLSEVSHAYKPLFEAGYEIDFVSPNGGTPPVDGYNLKDSVNKWFVENLPAQKKIANTYTPEQINPKEYVAIYYAGGHGTMWDFPENHDLAAIAAKIYENGGIVSAVCHGSSALINIKLSNGEYLVKDKKLAAFTDEEEAAVQLINVVPFLLASTLKKRGAIHIPAANWDSNVQVDERLITGQNPASAFGCATQILSLLENELSFLKN
jgi:putative intracellular protease/amidase